MFYKLTFDTDRIDEAIKNGINTIYAEATNMDEIIHENIKKGFFDNIVFSSRIIQCWPNVEFYYSSKASNLESDFLLNVKRWPIVHVKVKEEFSRREVQGLQYYPIKLIDVVTQTVNTNYVLMYITNFIDAYDMERSKYNYNAKYDFYTFFPKETYLDERKCVGYDIFRCSKNVAAIYVSQKIKEIIEEKHWVGFKFYEQQ